MEIDIISFTPGQYERLTDEQLVEVCNVQLKKNSLLRALEKDKQTAKYKMLQNGTYVGSSYAKLCERLQAVCDEEVDTLRNGLLFYLRYAVRDDGDEAPYLVDYSLDYTERIDIVRAYYETAYPDPADRVLAFNNDKVALTYLGEYFAPIYEIYYTEAYLNKN